MILGSFSKSSHNLLFRLVATMKEGDSKKEVAAKGSSKESTDEQLPANAPLTPPKTETVVEAEATKTSAPETPNDPAEGKKSPTEGAEKEEEESR